jgi:hypothetical protein
MSDAGFETAQRVEAAASERTAVEAARQFLPDVVLFVSYVVVGVGALVAIIAGCWALSSGIGLVVWHVCTFFGANPASWSISNLLPDAEPNPSYAAVGWGFLFALTAFAPVVAFAVWLFADFGRTVVDLFRRRSRP